MGNKAQWPNAVARRLCTSSAAINYTQSRCGLTLHVHCAKGDHVVDVEVAPGAHPDLVAKTMLRKGWTFGSKLACPDHSRREKIAPIKPAEETEDMTASLRSRDATPEQRTMAARQLAAMRWNKTKEPTPMQNPNLTVVSTETEAGAPERQPSEAAKKAKRLIYQCLEDYYDDQAKAYRPGHSDESIAKETGASVAFVREIREADFGPIGMPSELRELFELIGSARTKIEATRSEFESRLRIEAARVDELNRKLAALCRAKGWPEPA